MKTIKLFFLLLFFVAGLASLSSCSSSKDDEPENPDTREWVDLGLPSGTLWATCNIGANAPEEYGYYFAWGETEPKEVYSWNTYKWCNGTFDTITKYLTEDGYTYGFRDFTDGKTELDSEDDAAYVNLGPEWRMPSMEQQLELVEQCTWTQKTRNGVNGMLVKGPNGNTIFLPAAGGYVYNPLYSVGSDGYYVGSDGYYWSRTLCPNHDFSDCSFGLAFLRTASCGPDCRINGLTVRAVRVSKN